ncbi:hypothetical protein C8R46DRAFT_1246298 [Mycena filopes]|nr:hypothetical protein C8R46DRAFT_1246298 [Mycena filopes]
MPTITIERASFGCDILCLEGKEYIPLGTLLLPLLRPLLELSPSTRLTRLKQGVENVTSTSTPNAQPTATPASGPPATTPSPPLHRQPPSSPQQRPCHCCSQQQRWFLLALPPISRRISAICTSSLPFAARAARSSPGVAFWLPATRATHLCLPSSSFSSSPPPPPRWLPPCDYSTPPPQAAPLRLPSVYITKAPQTVVVGLAPKAPKREPTPDSLKRKAGVEESVSMQGRMPPRLRPAGASTLCKHKRSGTRKNLGPKLEPDDYHPMSLFADMSNSEVDGLPNDEVEAGSSDRRPLYDDDSDEEVEVVAVSWHLLHPPNPHLHLHPAPPLRPVPSGCRLQAPHRLLLLLPPCALYEKTADAEPNSRPLAQ